MKYIVKTITINQLVEAVKRTESICNRLIKEMATYGVQEIKGV